MAVALLVLWSAQGCSLHILSVTNGSLHYVRYRQTFVTDVAYRHVCKQRPGSQTWVMARLLWCASGGFRVRISPGRPRTRGGVRACRETRKITNLLSKKLGQKKKVGVAPLGAPGVLGERHWCAPCCPKHKKKGKKTDTKLTRQFRVTIQTLQTIQSQPYPYYLSFSSSSGLGKGGKDC